MTPLFWVLAARAEACMLTSMPELPEAELGRKIAEEVGQGKVISSCRCDNDEIVFANEKPRNVETLLTGRRMLAAKRKGKYIWFEMDEGPHPIFHFGMTGAFRTKGDDPLPLRSSAKEVDRSWPPRFTKIQLTFEDGQELVMTNSRRLGRIRLAEVVAEDPSIAKLGFDPYSSMPTLGEFRRLLEGRNAVLKGLLLNQSFAAGVGNWIADEVLYQAKINPSRTVSNLSEQEVKAIHAKLKSVVAHAVKVDADKSKFPKSWLFHRRWNKGAKNPVPSDEVIEFDTIAGRTTAWVPAVQK